MSHAGRRWLTVFPFALLVVLCWLVVELARRLTTYYFVVSAIPVPALLIVCCYAIALLWHAPSADESPTATEQS